MFDYSKFKLATDSFILGFVAFPVAYYVVKRFGGALWEDVKKLAYKAWDKVKSKV